MRAAVLMFASLLALGDPPKDVIDFFRSMAAALADADRDMTTKDQQGPRNASQFLDHFDKAMPGYAEFSDQIEEMVSAGEVAATIEFVNAEGDDRKRTLELDWLLECEGRSNKRGLIKCTIEKRGKKWKITSISPIDFFKRD
jgi:hypothetical protein